MQTSVLTTTQSSGFLKMEEYGKKRAITKGYIEAFRSDGYIHYPDFGFTGVCAMCLVAQSCLTLCNPMDHSPPEYWSGLPCPPQGIFPIQDQTQVSCIAGRFFTTQANQAMSKLTNSKNLNMCSLLYVNYTLRKL